MPMNIQTTDAIKSLNAISFYRENGMFMEGSVLSFLKAE
jgi:hypothetical protein